MLSLVLNDLGVLLEISTQLPQNAERLARGLRLGAELPQMWCYGDKEALQSSNTITFTGQLQETCHHTDQHRHPSSEGGKEQLFYFTGQWKWTFFFFLPLCLILFWWFSMRVRMTIPVVRIHDVWWSRLSFNSIYCLLGINREFEAFFLQLRNRDTIQFLACVRCLLNWGVLTGVVMFPETIRKVIFKYYRP